MGKYKLAITTGRKTMIAILETTKTSTIGGSENKGATRIAKRITAISYATEVAEKNKKYIDSNLKEGFDFLL